MLRWCAETRRWAHGPTRISVSHGLLVECTTQATPAAACAPDGSRGHMSPSMSAPIRRYGVGASACTARAILVLPALAVPLRRITVPGEVSPVAMPPACRAGAREGAPVAPAPTIPRRAPPRAATGVVPLRQ